MLANIEHQLLPKFGPAQTMLELLETLEGDLELVLVGKHGGVVNNLDAKKRNNRHDV